MSNFPGKGKMKQNGMLQITVRLNVYNSQQSALKVGKKDLNISVKHKRKEKTHTQIYQGMVYCQKTDASVHAIYFKV